MSGYMSMRDVAEYLSVPLETVRRWRKTGFLPEATKFGKHVRWLREVIENWALGLSENQSGKRLGAVEWRGQALQRAGK